MGRWNKALAVSLMDFVPHRTMSPKQVWLPGEREDFVPSRWLRRSLYKSRMGGHFAGLCVSGTPYNGFAIQQETVLECPPLAQFNVSVWGEGCVDYDSVWQQRCCTKAWRVPHTVPGQPLRGLGSREQFRLQSAQPLKMARSSSFPDIVFF